jgi:hypothetical protein
MAFLDVRAAENCNVTLLHYAVNFVQVNFPDLTDFFEEIVDVERAFLVNYTDLQNELQQVSLGIEVTKMEIENLEVDGCLEEDKIKYDEYGSAMKNSVFEN